MRMLTLCALVALVAGCNIDFDGMTALDNAALDLAESGQVASVTCQPSTLDSASREIGQCIAQNEDGTRISADGTNVAIWSSSAPEVVSVDLVGQIRAESLVGTAWIHAEGSLGSIDSTQVTVQ